MSRIIAVLLTFCLAACGMKGALVLPPGPAPAPVLDKIIATVPSMDPAPPAGSNVNDVSTDPKPGTQ